MPTPPVAAADRSALPKYMQLREVLLREIAAGRLRVGDRLPPERALAQDLGVAVGTLRKTLAQLQQDGVIARLQGSGNYIKDTGKELGVYAFFRLERLDGGGLPRARALCRWIGWTSPPTCRNSGPRRRRTVSGGFGRWTA